MTPEIPASAWPGPETGGSAEGPGHANHRRAETAEPRPSPSRPGLCETCQSTGWVPSWDDVVQAYALVRCPDCED